MNIYEVRLERLRQVLRDEFAGNKAGLARAIKRQPAQVSQWFSGLRKVTEESARHIETALRKPPHWLDELDATATPSGTEDAGDEPSNGVSLREVLQYASTEARRQVLDSIRVQLVRSRSRYSSDDLERLLNAVDDLDQPSHRQQ